MQIYSIFCTIGSNNATFSLFERYYKENFPHWSYIVAHSPFLGIFFGCLVSLVVFGWLITDILCVILFLALRQNLIFLTNRLIICCQKKPTKNKLGLDLKYWNNFRKKYLEIAELCEQVQKFATPLILACYVGVISEIVFNLFYWIGPNTPVNDNPAIKLFQEGFFFFHYLMRIFAVTYSSAEVYHKCLSILQQIQKVPNCAYTSVVKHEKNYNNF